MLRALSLNGVWDFSRIGGSEKGQGQVPGDIYADLLSTEQIPDPFYRDNEEYLQWIGESDWVYERSFKVSKSLLASRCLMLQCEGLDTLATLRVNGKLVAKTENMFRRWEWDVKALLHEGENNIQVIFASAVKYSLALAKRRGLFDGKTPNKMYAATPGLMRKEPCNFGWDWGVKAVTCGIWRDIRIVAYDVARISDVKIVQSHGGTGSRRSEVGGRESDISEVGLTVVVNVDKTRRNGLRAQVSVNLKGALVTASEQAFRGKQTSVELVVEKPQLWWPNNLGAQPLYEVKVELLDNDGNLLDSQEKRVGLRTLRLDRHADEWGESFQFVINGVPFFAKGANWIPADAIQARMTPERYRTLIHGAAAANMNMLRVWGGGIYEDDSFYDACDELGICVWQEFMFGGGGSPVDDPAFRQNVIAEASDQLRRLRHHACIALWCGNNEMEMGHVVEGESTAPGKMALKDYGLLFDRMLAQAVQELHPDCDYWPSSPHSPHGDRQDYNNPTCGDAHLWDVWHEGKPFEWYRTCEHRFNSEFGFQSLPEPKTVYGFTAPEDRNLMSFVMDQHQRSHGNSTIMQYMLQWFRAPHGFENTLWLSQILQGMSIKYAVEHWRRMMPRGMGTLYWQLNDCWPVASWSSIDYHGRWKALHYMARHFFAPVMITGVEDVAKSSVAVHVTNDLLKTVSGTVRWVVTDVEGGVLEEGQKHVRAAAQSSRQVTALRLKKWTALHEKRGLLIWLTYAADGQPMSRNLVFFSRPVVRPRLFSPRPRHLQLDPNPKVKASVRKVRGNGFEVSLSTNRPVLWVWLELPDHDAQYSDNFIHLRPGENFTMRVTPCQSMSVSAFRKCLKVRSLVDTYQEYAV